MEKLNIIISVFLIEFVVDYLVLKIFKIKFKLIYLLFLQIPKICASIVCLEYSQIWWLCFVSKFASKLFCLFFLTDSFKFKKMLFLMFTEYALLFAVAGLTWFICLWIHAITGYVFVQKIPKFYNFLIIFCIFLFFFAFFRLVRFLEYNKFLKKHLAKVSLSLSGKHIVFYGLIDSGNSLVDPLTRKPVVLISLKSLEKFLKKEDIDWLLKVRCRKIKCDTITGSGFEIPVFDYKNLELNFGEKNENVSCVLGLVNQKFENGKYDCLLNRDFL